MSAIRLQRVSKQFWVSHEKPALVRELMPRLVHPLRTEPFWALREIDLEVAPGTACGLIGPNGSGKTTLLSVIAGITQPTTGAVHVAGKVGALLSLGSGFHPELTGLENVFLNGTLLGMTTQELRRKLESIVAFSQLNGFLDAPLQTYSEGMKLRLGFAIAIHAECDVLVVDEVVQVGDVAFQARCLDALRAFKRAGKTLVLAAQSAAALQPLVDRALLVDQGRVIADGTVDHVRRRYAVLAQRLASVHEALSVAARSAIQEQVDRHDPTHAQRGWGERRGGTEVRVEAVRLLDHEGREVRAVDSGAAMTVAIRLSVREALSDPHIGVAIFREDGTYCYGPNTRMDGLQFHRLEMGVYDCRLSLEAVTLSAGAYRLSVAVWDAAESSPYVYHIAGYSFVIRGPHAEGVLVLNHLWRQVKHRGGGDAPSLSVEGPGGAQQWFRTFEPLTLTAIVPSSPTSGTPMLRAECRGPHSQLWWVGSWSPQRDGHGPGEAWCYQLQIPRLSLLTGRYEWVVGWAAGEGACSPQMSATRAIDVIADRLDHGVAHLPHRWELRWCHGTSDGHGVDGATG